MTDQRYRTQTTTAKTNLTGSIAFSLLATDENGKIQYNYAIDPVEFPSRTDVKTQRLSLLGHHVRRLANSLEMDEEDVVSAALELTGEEADG